MIHHTQATRPTEDDLIARWFAPIAGPGGLGLRDDAALLSPPAGHELVITVDGLVAGVHFFADDPPASIAMKALGVNLSDLAAKGAFPLGFVLTLALPRDWTADWVEAFAGGLGDMALRCACPLLGGDTVKTTGPLTLSITALGAVPEGRMVKRFTALPGDVVFVSGSIGDSALGLQLRLQPDAHWVKAFAPEHSAFFADRYLHPQPRLSLRAALLAHASAAMDVSDGLIGDLSKMMRASGTGAEVDLDAVPLSPATRAAIMAEPTVSEVAWTGGDDYEVLCAVPAAAAQAFRAEALKAGVAVTEIGHVMAAKHGVRFMRDGAEQTFSRGSYSHF
jgi:thiamine-monophosphate kinase